MLKHVLLASAMLIATPALAQNQPQTMTPPSDTNAAPAQPQTAPAPQTPSATNPAPQTTPAPTAEVPAAPATANTQPQSSPSPTTPAPNAQAANPAPADSATAAATPSGGGAQVADVVNSEFGTYDKNSDGKLTKTEFGAWMTALRTKADPSVKDDAANKAWVAQAFTQADSDKSKTISKDELTNFLSQSSGQKAS
jgi:hypothetical protein